VFAAAVAVIRDPDEADEIAQEVFVKLHSNIQRLNDPNAISAWLVKTSANLARDRLRFRRIRRWFFAGNRGVDDIQSDMPSPETTASRSQMFDVFSRWAKAKLSARERVVLQLKLGEEMTFQEIAQSLNVSTSTAKTHYNRAMAKLEALRKTAGGIS